MIEGFEDSVLSYRRENKHTQRGIIYSGRQNKRKRQNLEGKAG